MKIIRGIILTVLFIISSCSSGEHSVANKNTTKERADELNKLLRYSVSLMDSSEYEIAAVLLDSLESVALLDDNKTLLSGVLNNQGNYHYRLGDFEESIHLIEASLELDNEFGDSTSIGAKLKNIGISYKAQGNQQKAIRYYRESLIIFNELQDSMEVASLNNSIGNVYNSLKNYGQALSHLNTAEAIWNRLEEKNKLVFALGNKGNALLGIGKADEAINIYKQALLIKRQIGKKSSTAITLNNLGEAYLKQNRFLDAEKQFLESIQLREESGQRAGIALVANNMANLEIQKKDYRASQNWLNKAKQIIEETGATDKKLENLRLQRELFAQTGKYKSAYEIDILYDQINETAFKEQVVEVNEIQYEYDLDQEEKAKELAESKYEVSEANAKVQQFRSQIQRYIILVAALVITLIGYFAYNLRKKNRHIENLIRELHHRVKNHLGMISGMFGAQTEVGSIRVGSISNTDLLEEAKTRVEAVNGIHRRLYRQDEYEFVNMQEYLTELVDNSALVFGLFNKIEKQLEIQNEPLEIDKAISVGLIANEVLTNAFKYGLQTTEQPMLKIVLEKALKGYRMIIFNNAKPNEQPITESTGFGKELIKSLTDNLKGHSHTTQQNGFRFELTFP